jgi:GNAT superfamily N-acetyltransferase
MSTGPIHIRPATFGDGQALRDLILGLARFEKAEDQVAIRAEDLEQDGFHRNPPAFVAFLAEKDEVAIGFSLAFVRYSTWRGRMWYIEDLYVQEAFRGQGAGRMLLEAQMNHARSEGIGQICLQALEWNEPAFRFYRKFGATEDPEWVNLRIDIPPAPAG